MTIQEFYEWAVKNHLTDYKLTVGYSDDGGSYPGSRDASVNELIIRKSNKEVEL